MAQQSSQSVVHLPLVLQLGPAPAGPAGRRASAGPAQRRREAAAGRQAHRVGQLTLVVEWQPSAAASQLLAYCAAPAPAPIVPVDDEPQEPLPREIVLGITSSLAQIRSVIRAVEERALALQPTAALSWLKSVAALADVSNNVFGEPLAYFRIEVTVQKPGTAAMRCHVFLAPRIYEIHADYDLWNVMENLEPLGTVVPCPPRPPSVAAQVREAQLAGVPVQLDSNLIHSNVPPKLLDDPSRWYTVDGLLKLVENSGYREVSQPPGLTVELRRYQRQTLAWMLDKERQPGGVNSCFWQQRTITNELGETVHTYYYCPLAGELLDTAPPCNPGGFVCEEMGLGKTVEALALILANRAAPYAERRSTLIVVPKTLLHQWETEILQRVEPSALSFLLFSAHKPAPLDPARFGYLLQEAKAVRAAANKHALQMGTVVHPAGAAIMSGPGIEALYQVVDVEGHKIAEKIGCDKIGHFAQGSCIAIAEVKQLGLQTWGRIKDPPYFNGCRALVNGQPCGWVLVKDVNNNGTFIELVAEARVRWTPVAVTSQILSSVDVVLTTYEDIAPGSETSKRKGSMTAAAKMLLKVPWLRVILDESQRLTNSRTVVAEAAVALDRHYSWLLSGTPAGQAVEDLVGQLQFLRVEPWCRMGNNVHNFWDREITARWQQRDPEILDTLHTLLAHIMMRHSKSQTVDGEPILVLPPRTVLTRFLEPAHRHEAFVYDYLYAATRNQVETQLQLCSAGDKKKAQLEQLLTLLLAQCSSTSTLPLYCLDDSRLSSGEIHRRREFLSRLSSFIDLPTDTLECMLRAAQWNPVLILKTRNYSEDEIADIIVKLNEGLDLPISAATAAHILQNRSAYTAGSAANNDTLELLDHLARENCVVDRKKMLSCSFCRARMACPLCKDLSARVTLTWCFHLFCHNCIHKHLQYCSVATQRRTLRGPCPMCRKVVSEQNLTDIVPQSIVEDSAPSTIPEATTDELSVATEEPLLHFVDCQVAGQDQALGHFEAPHGALTKVYSLDDHRLLAPEEALVVFDGSQASVHNHTFVGRAVVVLAARKYEPGQSVRFALEAPTINKALLAHYDISVSVQGAKVMAASTAIRKWHDEDQSCKVVVFSSHPITLELLALAYIHDPHPALLPDGMVLMHAAPTRNDRVKALQRFQQDPSARVLLLDTHNYHAGLTLTVASKLILMDLAPSATMEKQLISRVHRIGQTRPVTILRLIMKNTIEHELYLRRWRELTRQPKAKATIAFEAGDQSSAAASEPAGAAAAADGEDDFNAGYFDEEGDEQPAAKKRPARAVSAGYGDIEERPDIKAMSLQDILSLLTNSQNCDGGSEHGAESATVDDYTELLV